MNRNKKNENVKTNKAIDNQAGTNTIAALNAVSGKNFKNTTTNTK